MFVLSTGATPRLSLSSCSRLKANLKPPLLFPFVVRGLNMDKFMTPEVIGGAMALGASLVAFLTALVSRKKEIVHRHLAEEAAPSRWHRGGTANTSAPAEPPIPTPQGSFQVANIILGFLLLAIAGACGFLKLKNDNDRSAFVAVQHLRVINLALRIYQGEKGDYPPELAQLLNPGRDGKPFLIGEGFLIDPWGYRYQYNRHDPLPNNPPGLPLVWTTERPFLGLGPQRKLTNRDVPD
jgi:hypothetical protein